MLTKFLIATFGTLIIVRRFTLPIDTFLLKWLLSGIIWLGLLAGPWKLEDIPLHYEFWLKPSILVAGQGVVVSVSWQASISRHFGRHRRDTGSHMQPFGGINGQLGGYSINSKWWLFSLRMEIFTGGTGPGPVRRHGHRQNWENLPAPLIGLFRNICWKIV